MEHDRKGMRQGLKIGRWVKKYVYPTTLPQPDNDSIDTLGMNSCLGAWEEGEVERLQRPKAQ